MATQPFPEAEDSRYAPYIAELHEFFATSGIPFGTPDAIFAVTDRLQGPGTFPDDLASLVRSIVLRQGGAMPHAQLLEIISLAIAGPEMARAPQHYSEPLRQLLTFISGVMRRPWNVPPSDSAEVLPFPTDIPTRPPESPENIERHSTIADAMLKNQEEPHPDKTPASLAATGSEQQPHAATHLPPVSDFDRASAPPSTLRRNLLIGSAATLALGAVLLLVLRPHSPTEVFHVGPAPTQTAAPLPSQTASQRPSSATNARPPSTSRASAASPQGALSAQPSAYGNDLPSQADQHPESVSPAVTPPAPVQSASSQTPSRSFPSSQPAAAPQSSPGPTGSFRSRMVPIAPGSRITVSSGVMAAYLIFAPDPEYPALARIAHIQGQVILQVVVAKDGAVSSIRVLRGNRLLRGAAQDAVRHWRYRPYRVAGRPIDVATIVTVDFHKRS